MEPREKAYDAGVFDVAVLNEDGAGELARLGVRFGGDEGEGERGNGLLFLRVRTKRRKKKKYDPVEELRIGYGQRYIL